MNRGNGFVLALTLSALLVTSLPLRAGIVGTEQMVTQETRAISLDRIEHVLAGEVVATQLEAWGVAPETVSARLAALSDVELQQLAANMESDPASETFQSWPIPSGTIYAGIVRHMRPASDGSLLIHQSATNHILRVRVVAPVSADSQGPR